MGLGDGAHDRQSEASAAVGPGTAEVRAPEALEGVRQEVGREARTPSRTSMTRSPSARPMIWIAVPGGANRSALSTRLSTASRIRSGSIAGQLGWRVDLAGDAASAARAVAWSALRVSSC